MRGKTEILPIARIRLDFQPSENLIEDRVLEYIEMIQRGEKFPPIKVRFDGADYFCEDGFHRVEALKRTRSTEVRARVSPGTLPEMEARFRSYLSRLKAALGAEAARNRKEKRTCKTAQ